MLEKLNETQKKAVETVRQNAINQGYRAYIVGGVVRDLILDKKIKDIDFLIEGSAIEFSQKSGFKIISKHPEFDTVKVEIEGINYDIASTRTEYYKKNGALPSVEFVGVEIEKDLKRRDFTINAIAINIINNEIIDPYLGQKDIKDGILRVLHNKSFMDDPTRILRGLDFKYRFNFEFGDFEKNLIKECKDNFNNEGLSIDRIYLTLNKSKIKYIKYG